MISHPHRCLSVHIPKAAGNSINQAFGIGWENHKDLALYPPELPADVFASYFKFTVVRNPWERLLSDYNYQIRKSRPEDSRLLVRDRDGGRRDFAEWAALALSTGDAGEPSTWGGEVSPGIHRFSPQVAWISVDGRVGVDFVARLETIDRDFERIRAKAGLAVRRLPRRNSRLHAHYAWYYDDATRDLVAARYAADVAEFGYRFEESPLRRWWRGWRAPRAADAGPTGEPVPFSGGSDA